MLPPKSIAKLRFPFSAAIVWLLLSASGGSGQLASNSAVKESGREVGQPIVGARGITQSTGDIMANPAATARRKNTYIKREFEIGRENRPQDPGSRFAPQPPPRQVRSATAQTGSPSIVSSGPYAAQAVGLTFNGVNGYETGAFPPDSMG